MFRFEINAHLSGSIHYFGVDEPRTGELMYLVQSRERHVDLVVCTNNGTSYDGGRSGDTWIALQKYGTPAFQDGVLMVPESTEGLRRVDYGDYGFLIPRSAATDFLVRMLVAVLGERDTARRDGTLLEKSLSAIFADLVVRAKAELPHQE